jgi:hypothetical protein
MKPSVRRFVRLRAGRRCEYRRLHESDQPFLGFHLEHIIAKQHHGSDHPDNLAWSCLECNAAKSSNLSGRELVTRRVVELFDPRRQRWNPHFAWEGRNLSDLPLRACDHRCPQH